MGERTKRHLVLIGEFDLMIDEKHRMQIPSEIRRKLDIERDGNEFYLLPGPDSTIWLYCEHYFEDLIGEHQRDITPGQEQLDFAHVNFALASNFEPDGQGRLMIPEKQRTRSGVGREITLIGAGDHLEIWNRAQWKSRLEALLPRQAEIAVKAKRARKADAGAGATPADKVIAVSDGSAQGAVAAN